MVKAAVTHAAARPASAVASGGKRDHSALPASSTGFLLAAALLTYQLTRKRWRGVLKKSIGRFRDWLDRNALGLVWIGVAVLAMLLAALLGASLLWVILTGVFTLIGFTLLVLLVFILFGGDRYRPMPGL